MVPDLPPFPRAVPFSMRPEHMPRLAGKRRRFGILDREDPCPKSKIHRVEASKACKGEASPPSASRNRKISLLLNVGSDNARTGQIISHIHALFETTWAGDRKSTDTTTTKHLTASFERERVQPCTDISFDIHHGLCR